MAVETPTINKIYKMTEFDLARTSYTPGNMYICLDSYKLYYDETKSRRVTYDYVSVSTVNDLRHNITPDYGKTYYCWEDNSLWLWMNKWVTLWSDSTYPSAYVYDDWSGGNLSEVYRHDQPLLSADDNGLLHDGSVVVRDTNRIIKGRIYVDSGNDNFIISSYLGGGLRFLPNGQMTTDGEFLIDEKLTTVEDNEGNESEIFIPTATLRAEFKTLNHEMYVDYSEDPDLDNNPYSTDTHVYRLYHTGNLDSSALHVLTGEEIYQKLRELNRNLDLSVMKFDELTSDHYSKLGHTHTSTDITDFTTAARGAAGIELDYILQNANAKGITINYNSTSQTKQLNLIMKKYTVRFRDAVVSRSGNMGDPYIGSGYLFEDSSGVFIDTTTFDLTINPLGHVHEDIIDTLAQHQAEINNLSQLDPSLYATRELLYTEIGKVQATDVPTDGKPLNIQTINGVQQIPITSENTLKLRTPVTINYTNDITGTVTTDFSLDAMNISLSADNIISTTPTAGKALKMATVSGEIILPAKAQSAKVLDHNLSISLTGIVKTTNPVVWDTSTASITIPTIFDTTNSAYDNLLLKTDIDTLVPGLTGGFININQLPNEVLNKLVYRGSFNTLNPLPTQDMRQGDIYIASEQTTVGGVTYAANDWAIYIDSSWFHLSCAQSISSVNGVTAVGGNITITADDNATLNAISKNLINYTIEALDENGNYVRTLIDDTTGEEYKQIIDPDTGSVIPKDIDPDTGEEIEPAIVGYTEIPKGYVLKTYDDGELRGVGVDHLINDITFDTDDTSVISVTNLSTNRSVNGSDSDNTFGIDFEFSSQGYNNLLHTVGFNVKSYEEQIPHEQYLKFLDGFTITRTPEEIDEQTGEVLTEGSINIEVSSNASKLYLYYFGENTTRTEEVPVYDEDGNPVIDPETNEQKTEEIEVPVINNNLDEIISKLNKIFDTRADFPFILDVDYNYDGVSGLFRFKFDSSVDDIDPDNGLVLTDNILRNGHDEYDAVTLFKNTLTMTLRYGDNVSVIEYLGLSGTSVLQGTLLSTTNNITDEPTPFVPTEDWQPATKQYVDNVVSGSVKTYSAILPETPANSTIRIDHNLGVSNPIVQFRSQGGQQVYIENTLLDINSLVIHTDTAIQAGTTRIIIIGC